MIRSSLQSVRPRRRRSLSLAALALGLLSAAAASAQHGGMGGPGGSGIGMGGPRGGGMMAPAGGGERGGERRGGFLATGPVRTAPQLGPPGRWWNDKHVMKSLNLRTDQQRRMDDLFEANKGNLQSLLDNLQREEQRLSTMPREDLQDETKVFAAIDRVTQARAELAKAHTHVMLQLRRELDPTQLAELDKEIARQ